MTKSKPTADKSGQEIEIKKILVIPKSEIISAAYDVAQAMENLIAETQKGNKQRIERAKKEVSLLVHQATLISTTPKYLNAASVDEIQLLKDTLGWIHGQLDGLIEVNSKIILKNKHLIERIEKIAKQKGLSFRRR